MTKKRANYAYNHLLYREGKKEKKKKDTIMHYRNTPSRF